jgi:hypothetical protein
MRDLINPSWLYMAAMLMVIGAYTTAGFVPHQGEKYCRKPSWNAGMVPGSSRYQQELAYKQCERENTVAAARASPGLIKAGWGSAVVLLMAGLVIGGPRSLLTFAGSTLNAGGWFSSGLSRRREGDFMPDPHLQVHPDRDLRPTEPAPFHEHRMSRIDTDGQIGWWIEVPAVAAADELQIKLQSTPCAPLNLHVAVGGEWIAAVGPKSVLIHQLVLPAGKAWVRASLASPDGSTPLVELWLHPAPGAATDAPTALAA